MIVNAPYQPLQQESLKTIEATAVDNGCNQFSTNPPGYASFDGSGEGFYYQQPTIAASNNYNSSATDNAYSVQPFATEDSDSSLSSFLVDFAVHPFEVNFVRR